MVDKKVHSCGGAAAFSFLDMQLTSNAFLGVIEAFLWQRLQPKVMIPDHLKKFNSLNNHWVFDHTHSATTWKLPPIYKGNVYVTSLNLSTYYPTGFRGKGSADQVSGVINYSTPTRKRRLC